MVRSLDGDVKEIVLRASQPLKASDGIDRKDDGTTTRPAITEEQSNGRTTALHEAAGTARPLAAYGVSMNAFKPTDSLEGVEPVEHS